ncbi:MAG: DnaB-like helicase N-terminal domain-containing protein, partial [Patescibacteria group bacterium]
MPRERGNAKPTLSPFAGGIKLPPQNIEAEISTLGALMLDSNAVIRVTDILKPEDFYRPPHQTIYSIVIDLFERHQPIDVLSVSSRLKEKGFLEEIGGTAYLTDLVNAVPTSSNVAHYAEIVRKKKILRDLIAASSEIAELGYKEGEEVEELLDSVERKVFAISQGSLKQKFLPLKDALEEAW